MRKRLFCILAALLFAAPGLAPAARAVEAAPPPALSAAYLVMDADTGQVLIEQNADERRSPASITKIMTMGLAMEKAQGALDTQLTVSYDDVHQLEAGSSHIALIEGEQVRLEDVLYGTEIASANDGANVLAEYVGGSIQAGVDAMNQKAGELGLESTHFTNPHGLYDENHYTTARDMAQITRWALGQPGFAEVFCRTETWTMAPTNLQPEERFFSINDWMRLSGKYYRSYAKGSKQGFHDQAQYTFVCYAEQSGMRLICVILGAPQRYDKFTDACALLDYCFASFTRVDVADEKGFTVPVAGRPCLRGAEGRCAARAGGGRRRDVGQFAGVRRVGQLFAAQGFRPQGHYHRVQRPRADAAGPGVRPQRDLPAAGQRRPERLRAHRPPWLDRA